MSANTLVSPQFRRLGRRVLAGAAGLLVSAVGVVTTVDAARGLGTFSLAPGGGSVDLVAAAAAGPQLAEHETLSGAAQLSDPALTQGLPPGASAFFGYRLGLTASSVPLAMVTMNPVVASGPQALLSYEVRQVADAQKCREQWDAGQVLVLPRGFGAGPSEGFAVRRMDDSAAVGEATQLCIKVGLAASANGPQTSPVSWRFLAVAATS